MYVSILFLTCPSFVVSFLGGIDPHTCIYPCHSLKAMFHWFCALLLLTRGWDVHLVINSGIPSFEKEYVPAFADWFVKGNVHLWYLSRIQSVWFFKGNPCLVHSITSILNKTSNSLSLCPWFSSESNDGNEYRILDLKQCLMWRAAFPPRWTHFISIPFNMTMDSMQSLKNLARYQRSWYRILMKKHWHHRQSCTLPYACCDYRVKGR